MKNKKVIISLFFVIFLIGVFLAREKVLSSYEDAFYATQKPQNAIHTLRRVILPTSTEIPLKTPETENLENETDPYYLLNHFSREYGVDFELAFKIVECESNFNRYAKNGSSSAESYFQFIDKTFEETMKRMNLPTSTSKFDMPIAIEAGVWLLKKDGVKHWESSESCWL